MEKNRTILATAAFLLLFFASCKTSSEDIPLKDNQVKFDTLTVEKRQHLNNDTANPYCDLKVHFVYPSASNEVSLQRLHQLFIRNTFGTAFDDLTPREAIDKYTNNFVQNYEADARVFQRKLEDLENHPQLVPQNLDTSHEQALQSTHFYTYLEALSSNVHFNKGNLLSFQVNRINKKGSSATYSAYHNYVISLETGELVTENDLFIGGYDVALQQLFASKLMQQNNVNNIYDLEELGYFGIEEIMPNRNFLIDEKGVTYIFNKGEYSAYLLDAQEIFIPFEDISVLLRENTLVSKLAEQ